MHKYIAIISIYMAAAGVNLCLGQLNNSQTITNWGESVQGVQLSITMTNSVFRCGVSANVAAVTKNISTNAITVEISAPTLNFDVLLTSSAGQLYHVTTPMMVRSRQRLASVMPGGESAESIPVTFGENISPGDYTLKATRRFTLNDRDFTLESNSIKVKIVK